MQLFLLSLFLLVAVLAYVGFGVYEVIVLDTKKYAKYWLDQAKIPIEPGAIHLLAFGDSTFQSVGATKPQLGTVGRAATYLAEKTGRPVHVTNLSVSGAQADDVAKKQLPQADFDSADAIIIAVGANDANRQSDIDTFRTAIEKITASVPADRTVMADVAFVRHRDAYQAIITAERNKHGIAGANLAESFQGVSQPWRLSARDFFHPSNYGYQFWFGAFQPEIDKLIIKHHLKLKTPDLK